MTNCPVCQRDTQALNIGGQQYCSVCGSPAAGTPEAPVRPARRSLDLSPRARSAADTAPAALAAAQHHSAAAGALHRRVKPSSILDLRHVPVSRPEVARPQAAPNHTPATPPSATTRERHLAHVSARLEQAKQVGRSPHIQKFSGSRPDAPRLEAQPTPQPAVAEVAVPELPQAAVTQHEALTRLVPAPPPEPPASRTHAAGAWRPNLRLSPHAGRIAATTAAVAIMGGYIWFHNYPKLALQNANAQAGITASLPGYVPSSYTLKNTDTAPGLVTLNFASPSSSEALKIAQQRTSWDSSSLLDNYIAKTTDDYAAVQGQGLTIYLFNNNQAAWVNHGIWYSIEGASRLSREQILKIAYSL